MSDHPILHRIEDKIEELGGSLKKRIGHLLHSEEEGAPNPVDGQTTPASAVSTRAPKASVEARQGAAASAEKPDPRAHVGKTKALKRSHRKQHAKASTRKG